MNNHAFLFARHTLSHHIIDNRGDWSVASNITDAEIRSRTKSDPHSLGRFRVNGALPHIDMWYDAFGVKVTDAMLVRKEQRLSLW